MRTRKKFWEFPVCLGNHKEKNMKISMVSLNEEEISRCLSHTLDCLGYSSQMVQIRKNFYSNTDKTLNLLKPNKRTRTVGSRGEGLVKYHESDHDYLVFSNFVLVVEDFVDVECIPDTVTVFRMIPCLSHPGRYKLLLIIQGTGDLRTIDCLNPLENDFWLSSKEFVTKNQATDADINKMSGPANTSAWPRYGDSYDSVQTFVCVCPSIIQHWLQRPRQHDWPPSDLRERISYMSVNIAATGHKGCPDEEIEWRLCFNEVEILLVDTWHDWPPNDLRERISYMSVNIAATGHKGCPDEEIEWRLCFNEVEILLVETWNDTQRKLYKILKLLNKDVIVKAGFDISSYIMKNIVLWLSEKYPQSGFRSENLLLWVMKSLKLFKKVVKIYNLPYYMIPGRNLIAERIPRCQQKSLMKEISALIQCGPQLLWECERLEFAMSMTPSELLYYKEKCDRLEVLFMMHYIQGFYDKVTNTDSHIKADIAMAMAILLKTDWPSAVTELLKDTSGNHDQVIVLLS